MHKAIFYTLLAGAWSSTMPLLHAAQTNWLDPNHPITLTTAEVPAISVDGQTYKLGASLWYVDAQLTADEAQASAFVFNDLKAALTEASGQKNIRILLAPGVYWLDNPDDPEVRRGPDGPHGTGIPYAVEVHCPGLQLVGLNPDSRYTVVAVNRGQTQGALGNYTMLHLSGDDLSFENVTLGNYCNVDLEYPHNTQLSRAKRGDAIVQAQLAICDGSDRVVAQNCRFISRLNLCPLVGARRTVFRNCYFECTDDALAGSAVYVDCRFTFFSSKPFYNTSTTGAIFLRCQIDTHTRGTQYLTKVPGAVTLIDTDFHTLYDADSSPLRIDWTRQPEAAVCYQHHVTLNGKPYVVGSEARTPGVTLMDTDPLLAAYRLIDEGDTIYNVANLVAGDDGWDPLNQRHRIADMEAQLGASLTGLPVALRVETSRRYIGAQNDTLSLKADLLRWGGYPVEGTFVQASSLRWNAPGYLAISPTGYTTAVGTSRNRFDQKLSALVTATNDYGCQGAANINVAPHLTAAPTFSATPTIAANKKQKQYAVAYSLGSSDSGTTSVAGGSDADRSNVTWYRCPDAATAEALCAQPQQPRKAAPSAIAAYSATGKEGMNYTPTRADLNGYIVAVVTPQLRGSQAGEPAAALFGPIVKGKLLSWTLFDEQKISTDFHTLPCSYQPRILAGNWTFDAYKPADTDEYPWSADAEHAWYYGPAQDAAVGQGLVQQSRGARLFYTPTRTSCRSMRLTAIVDPCKSGGQGFGSATGQYMDFYIAFDPTTLTGYGLRVERTAKHDKAVTFTLMRYDHGQAEAISTPQASSCFRSSCTLHISLVGGQLSANASTSAPEAPAREGVSPTVSLQATVSAPESCAFGIQHTGTTGAGATMIHYLEAEWN